MSFSRWTGGVRAWNRAGKRNQCRRRIKRWSTRGQGVWLFSLTQVSFSFALRSVRNREAVPAAIKSLAPSVLWLACEVHFGRAALQAQRLKYGFRNSVGQTTEWSMRNGITQILA